MTDKQTLLSAKIDEDILNIPNRDEFTALLRLNPALKDKEVDDILNEIDFLFNSIEADIEAKNQEEILADPDGKSKAEKEEEVEEAKIAKRLEVSAIAEAEAPIKESEALLIEGHIVQDSSEQLKVKEPIAPDNMFTSPIDLQEADYSIVEDYPDTYGFVDTVKNWFKINKKQKYAEFVHASGSMLKCDKDGNTTIEIKGKMKMIQRGEMTHFIGDNLDIAIDGSFYHHIMSNLKQVIDGNSTQTIGGSNTINVSGAMKTKASRIDLN